METSTTTDLLGILFTAFALYLPVVLFLMKSFSNSIDIDIVDKYDKSEKAWEIAMMEMEGGVSFSKILITVIYLTGFGGVSGLILYAAISFGLISTLYSLVGLGVLMFLFVFILILTLIAAREYYNTNKKKARYIRERSLNNQKRLDDFNERKEKDEQTDADVDYVLDQ
ncbi:hypothetical protein ACFQMF_12780 [Halorubrum rutilum]|uniref:Uncharacterized protein n=1 Tax=Halorubrum rutilum TaxID=1364933 RepID=A0ABD6AMD3_9EURY|nr:hypothetical protein [Halorubrum rutilum]